MPAQAASSTLFGGGVAASSRVEQVDSGCRGPVAETWTSIGVLFD